MKWQSSPKKKKKTKKLLILVITLWVIAGALIALVVVYSNLAGSINHVELDTDDLGIEKITKAQTSKETQDGESTDTWASVDTEIINVKNIAAFGLSVTDEDGIDTNRSDVIMIISLDEEANRVCLTSILRDTQAEIEGYYPQKINAAYKYGGAPLAIKTLNQNFHLDIADYITYRDTDIADIIDYLGGVEIEVTADEIYSAGLSCEPGWNTLMGDEATWYARIRDIDSDYCRASRQQVVIMAMLSKVKQMPVTEYPALISMVLGCTESSLDFDELLGYAFSFDVQNLNVVKNTVPDIEYETDLWGGTADTGEWLYKYDLDKAALRIHKIIYERSEDGR